MRIDAGHIIWFSKELVWVNIAYNWYSNLCWSEVFIKILIGNIWGLQGPTFIPPELENSCGPSNYFHTNFSLTLIGPFTEVFRLGRATQKIIMSMEALQVLFTNLYFFETTKKLQIWKFRYFVFVTYLTGYNKTSINNKTKFLVHIHLSM